MSSAHALYETSKLRLEMETDGVSVIVRPVGTIDEDVNFSVVLDSLSRLGSALKLIQFDMSMITQMNSCGVREWLLFMERLPQNVRVVFLNANEIFIEQANMISNVLGKKGTQLVEFQAPYHCSQCNADYVMLIKPSQVKFEDGIPQPPAFKCAKCSTALNFDSIEEEYFGFIKRLPKEG